MKRFVSAFAAGLVVLPLVATAATPPPAVHGATAKASAHKPAAQKTAPAPSSIVSIALPTNVAYGYKNAPGVEVAQTYCLTCHSAGYVKMQPPMDAARWSATVAKMRKVYGLHVSDADAAKIADYLGTAYGPPAL